MATATCVPSTAKASAVSQTPFAARRSSPISERRKQNLVICPSMPKITPTASANQTAACCGVVVSKPNCSNIPVIPLTTARQFPDA